MAIIEVACVRFATYSEVVEKESEPAPIKLELERLTTFGFIEEAVLGVAKALGLGLLWALELVRDSFFRLLDRMNVRPRRRTRASAFPPGRPRKRSAG